MFHTVSTGQLEIYQNVNKVYGHMMTEILIVLSLLVEYLILTLRYQHLGTMLKKKPFKKYLK